MKTRIDTPLGPKNSDFMVKAMQDREELLLALRRVQQVVQHHTDPEIAIHLIGHVVNDVLKKVREA